MAIDVDSGVLWLGFGCYALAVGSGDFGRFLAFLALWRAWAVYRVVILSKSKP